MVEAGLGGCRESGPYARLLLLALLTGASAGKPGLSPTGGPWAVQGTEELSEQGEEW